MNTPQFLQNKKFWNTLLYIAILLPLVVYLWHVYIYATNIPRQDDYDAVLDFVNLFKHADWKTKVALLYKQHNEHRIVPSRIVYALYYYVFGEINFRHLIFIDALTLILLFLNIAFFVKTAMPSLWRPAVLVLSMCLFDIGSVENMDFAMAGLQNYGVILAFTASIYFYSRNRSAYLVLAALMQIICVFSSGNGNVGAALILLFVILSRNKRAMVVAVSTFLVFTPLYYYQFVKPASNFFTLDPSKFVPFFLHSVGTHFSFRLGMYAATFLLVVLLFTIPIERKFQIKAAVLPLLCLCAFALASLGVMSIFRGNLPIEASNASRYFIYSHILTALAFAFLVLRLQNEIVRNVVIVGSIFGLSFSYRWNCNEGSAGFQSFRNELKTMDYHYPDKERARKIAEESCLEGVYCIEKHRADKMPFEK